MADKIQLGGTDQKPPNLTNTLFPWGYSDNVLATGVPVTGAKSIFNEYATFRYDTAAGDYNMLYDKDPSKSITSSESRNPSAAKIISFMNDKTSGFSPYGSTPYSTADFLYCTYYGLIPNNYMVTLRRFPLPTLDNLKTPDGRAIPPVAQAITWMGEEPGNKLSEILKFSCGLAWKKIEASVQNVNGNEKGFESSGAQAVPGNNVLAGIIGFLNPNEYSGLARAQTEYSKELYESNGPYANKVYGPVNSITETQARDLGLHFEQDISLNFHYSLRSIADINPKVALLDVLANMLTLTYNNAKFWGGAIRYFPAHPNVPFFGDQSKFYSGDVGGYIDSIGDSFKDIGTGIGKLFSTLGSGDFGSVLKTLTGGVGGFLMGKIAAKDRPQIIAMKSLLTGAPVGEWHLVVGNPMNPIAFIGNLICTDMEVEFGDTLGADDFPTEVKFTIKLKHGRPRDKGDIESMFNLGNGRLYYGINDNNVFSSAHNSVVDTSGTKGEVLNNTALGSKSFKSTGQGDKNDISTYSLTPSQIRDLNSQAGSANKTPSMWGQKFQPFELQIAKTWAGAGGTQEKNSKTP